MSRSRKLFSSAWLLGFLLAPHRMAHCETPTVTLSDVQEQVLDEARVAWTRFAGDFVMTRAVLWSETRSAATEEMRASKAIVKRYGDNYLMDWDDSVRCINDKYAFHLRRPKAEKTWALASLSSNRDDPSFKELQNWVALQKVQVNSYPLTVISVLIADLVSHHSFRVSDLQTSELDPVAARVRFQIEESAAASERLPVPFRGGTLTLDRNHSWLPVRQELDYPGGVRLIVDLTDFTEQDGTSFPTKMTTSRREEDGSIWELARMTVQDIQIGGSIPNREFTLSAFGFPEPGHSPRRTPPYLWLTAGSIAMIAVGLYLRRRSQRHAP